MPVTIQSTNLPLSTKDVVHLWEAVIKYRDHADDEVTLRSVDRAESERLNKEYRNRKSPTNILTFSYPVDEVVAAEHDIALCFEVVEAEAKEREVPVRDYLAHVLVHGFLHATGMDHEQSAKEANLTAKAETSILKECGFVVSSL